MHHMTWSNYNKRWRETFADIAIKAQIPQLEAVEITAIPCMNGQMQDVGGCMPAIKAAIDGVVDAGVLPDDTPEYVTILKCVPPVKIQKIEGLWRGGALILRILPTTKKHIVQIPTNWLEK